MLRVRQFKVCKTGSVHIDKTEQIIIKNIELMKSSEEVSSTSSKKLSFSDDSHYSSASFKTDEESLRFSLLRDDSRRKNDSKEKKGAIKNLQNIKVQYKKIEDFQEERRKRRKAKDFIDRMHRDKSEFEGKLLLLKQREQKKKQMELVKLKAECKYQQNERMKKRSQAQQRIKIILSRILQRKKSKKKKKNRDHQPGDFNKGTVENIRLKAEKWDKWYKLERNQIIKSMSIPVNQFRNNHFNDERPSILKRSKTKQTHYFQNLSQQQKRQIKLIRQKISSLTRKLRQT